MDYRKNGEGFGFWMAKREKALNRTLGEKMMIRGSERHKQRENLKSKHFERRNSLKKDV